MRLLHVVAFSNKIILVGSNQGNYFENATACSKRTLKTTVATQLKYFFFVARLRPPFDMTRFPSPGLFPYLMNPNTRSLHHYWMQCVKGKSCSRIAFKIKTLKFPKGQSKTAQNVPQT